MADNKTISKLQINKTTYDLAGSEEGSSSNIEIDPATFTIGECYNYYINEGINTFTISGEVEIPGEDSSPIGTISGKNKLILLSIKKATDATQENLLYILCGILDRVTVENVDGASLNEEASPAFCTGIYTTNNDIVFGDGLTISSVNDVSDEIHTKKIYLGDDNISDQIYIACDGQTIKIGYNQDFLFPVTLRSMADNSGINVDTPIQADNIANKLYVDKQIASVKPSVQKIEDLTLSDANSTNWVDSSRDIVTDLYIGKDVIGNPQMYGTIKVPIAAHPIEGENDSLWLKCTRSLLSIMNQYGYAGIWSVIFLGSNPYSNSYSIYKWNYQDTVIMQSGTGEYFDPNTIYPYYVLTPIATANHDIE